MTNQEPIKVNNKDIPLLSRVLYIMQDIALLEKKQIFQRDIMLNITQHITGMPSGKGTARGIDDMLGILSELGSEYNEKVREYTRDLKTAERIINGIPSVTMRTFVTMRYMFGMPKKTIMRELNLSRWGFDRAVRAVENAPNMASVKWHERYILIDENGHPRKNI